MVEVTHLPTGRLYYFPCDRWLDRQQDDGHIVRLLKVLGQTQTNLPSLHCVSLSVQHEA